MMPWWPIVVSFAGALIMAVGIAFTVSGWPRYVVLCGSTLTAVGGLWFAIDQVSYNIGGDSYAYLSPYFMAHVPERNIVEVSLERKGSHPLYDIDIRVVDIEKFHEFNVKNPRGPLNPAQYERQYKQDRLDPRYLLRNFARWQLPNDQDQQSYNIWISARNGHIVEQVRFRRIDGEWRVALRVMRDGHVLIEEGREYLPRDEKGQPLWEQALSR